jgi:hypothetical protein
VAKSFSGVSEIYKVCAIIHDQNPIFFSTEDHLADLLLNNESRKEVARVLQYKKKPHAIPPEIWDKLLRAEVSSISFKDLQVLQKQYQNITRAFRYSRE